MRTIIPKRRAAIIAALAVAAIGILIIVRAYRDRGLLIDGAAVRLSDDPATARKELRLARSSLAKLKPGAPYLVVDTHANRIFLRTEDSIIIEAVCSTGSGGEYVDRETGRRWIFDTPRGVFRITSKTREPWWRKPDWAFLEEGEEIPKSEKERFDSEMMGDYALGFGKGYFIHGTIYERLLGISVTHGCVRVGSEDLKRIYRETSIGTYLYIF